VGIDPAHHGATAVVLVKIGAATELDALGVLRALQLPGVAVTQPMVRLLDLVAVLDHLAEHPVLVAQPVALDR
jgi:hypothetical protein